jgi:murein DD-endopeptidase MepM/ murein hydrolase activator NlpD
MSVRGGFPKARLSTSHYFLTVSRGEKIRSIAIRPWVVVAVCCVLPAVLAVYLAATLYLVFHDDMLAGLMARQTEMQYAYEDRLAAMRAQIDRVTSRQLLDQNTLEGRVHDLLSRQARLESRAKLIASLAARAGMARNGAAPAPAGDSSKPAAARTTTVSRSVNPLLAQQPAGTAAGALPADVSAFAPVQPPAGFDGAKPVPLIKPQPEEVELTKDPRPRAETDRNLLDDPSVPVARKLGSLSLQLEHLDANQTKAMALIGEKARGTANRLRSAMIEAGLPVDRLKLPPAASADTAMGGPFIPVKFEPDGSPFEREIGRLQNDFADAERLRKLALHIPFGQPLPGNLTVTSPFGFRIDPFFGRPALHPGVDLRQAAGSPVRATGGGKVVTAAWTGGYGNMVEIDHGNGLVTRYGHLSAILANEGQTVEAGTIIGRVGSTGRSTGPHLHYEIRVDGTPVDPMRFLRAGAKLDLAALAD